ncbi:acyl-CoA synthetase [Gordonia sp. NPDC003376]
MYPGTIARSHPDHPAVIIAETGQTLTFGQLDDRSRNLAAALVDAGLQRGDVVALLSDNAAEVFETFWATQRSGMYLTAVNWHLTADEAAYIVNDSGAKALIASGQLADLGHAVAELAPAARVRAAFGPPIEGFVDYEDFVGASSGTLDAQPAGSVMLYSSGTTGKPKGIKPPLPDRAVDEPGDPYIAMFQHLYGFDETDIYYSPAPVYHTAPLRWGGIIHALGGTVVMAQRFDPEESLRHIEKYRVTAAQMVPTMFIRMLKLDPEVRSRHDLSSLTELVHAAAPCPPEVKRQMIDWVGPIVDEYYSSTEANGVTFINSQEWLEHEGSVGRPGLGVIHICDDHGAELPVGEIGSIYFEREVLPFTYHGDPDKTAEAQHPDHPTWTAAGDIGYVDDEGYLYLTDRKSFMIISGGVNIYPQEIENLLALHPAVDDIAVIGVPDPEMGEQVKAVVKVSEGIDPSDALAAELIAYVRERMSHYKAPKSVDFVDDLPRTPTGKLVKGKLKSRYGHSDDVAVPTN